MSETKHSPEPWRVYDEKYPGIDSDSGDAVVFFARDRDGTDGGIRGGYTCGATPHDNARRIVACVNACAGIPTEALENGSLDWLLRTLVESCERNPQPGRSLVVDLLRSLGRLK